jgi:E3 ubiquitin-protein ligase FANCL
MRPLLFARAGRSFDVLFGNCPYCSDPVAVKVADR